MIFESGNLPCTCWVLPKSGTGRRLGVELRCLSGDDMANGVAKGNGVLDSAEWPGPTVRRCRQGVICGNRRLASAREPLMLPKCCMRKPVKFQIQVGLCWWFLIMELLSRQPQSTRTFSHHCHMKGKPSAALYLLKLSEKDVSNVRRHDVQTPP